MAGLLDLSDIVNSPEFASTFTVVRGTSLTNTLGRVVTSKQYIPNIVGVIQPASGEALLQLPDGARTNGALQVYTTYQLRGEGPNNPPDRIVWEGNSYLVTVLSGYQHSAGFSAAVCTLEDMTTG